MQIIINRPIKLASARGTKVLGLGPALNKSITKFVLWFKKITAS